VIGDDPVATAHAAIGIGRMQARRRRVAIGDLVGEVGPLQALVTGDDPHGIIDSFHYGVSLNKIARPVGDGGNLFVMPSGTEPVPTEEIFRNPRWQRLASGFREMGALLLLVAPASAPGVEDLVASVDGAVVVGDAGSAPIAASQVVATVEAPRRTRVTPTRGAPPAHRGERTRVRVPSTHGSGRGWLVPGAAAALVLAAAGVWLTSTAGREFRRGGEAGPALAVSTDSATGAAARPDTTAPVAAPSAIPPGGAAVIDDSTGTAEAVSPLVPANPADSAAAATYAVLVVTANTQTGANLKLQDAGRLLPVATVSPVVLGSDQTRWFQVIAGAYGRRDQADSLLLSLRNQGVVGPKSGTVVRAPFALLVERSVSRQAAKALASGYAGRGIPVYALLQADGSAQLYAGAFDTPERATLLAATLRTAGIAPTVVYRTGRPF
jgi:hypothetical protein